MKTITRQEIKSNDEIVIDKIEIIMCGRKYGELEDKISVDSVWTPFRTFKVTADGKEWEETLCISNENGSPYRMFPFDVVFHDYYGETQEEEDMVVEIMHYTTENERDKYPNYVGEEVFKFMADNYGDGVQMENKYHFITLKDDDDDLDLTSSAMIEAFNVINDYYREHGVTSTALTYLYKSAKFTNNGNIH